METQMKSEYKVLITENDVQAIKQFLEKQYQVNFTEMDAQKWIDELTHWIGQFGDDV
jgi:hypothetical protein